MLLEAGVACAYRSAAKVVMFLLMEPGHEQRECPAQKNVRWNCLQQGLCLQDYPTCEHFQHTLL